MAEESTPKPDRETPSLPSSPDPKRTKFTEPLPSLTVASILNDTQPTPTPETAQLPNPMANAAPSTVPTINPISPPLNNNASAPILPSMATEPPPLPLQVKLLSASAKPPSRSSAFAAGYDLYASAAATVPAWGKVLVDTDISVALPAETYGRVAPRSGLASKHSIHTGAGVIDADYRGPVKVLLFNLSGEEFKVAAGDRVAQLIVERIYTPEVMVVEELEETVRGAGGFGSTGGFGGALPPLNGV